MTTGFVFEPLRKIVGVRPIRGYYRTQLYDLRNLVVACIRFHNRNFLSRCSR